MYRDSPLAGSLPVSTALLSGWRFRALLWSVAAAALGYLIFVVWSGWREVAQAVARVGVWGVGVALLLSLLNFSLRFVRWQIYLRQMRHKVALPVSLNVYLAGFALSTTPSKLGEALRSVLLISHGVPYRHGIAAFLSERLSDLSAIVLVGLIGLAAYPKATVMVATGLSILVFMFALMSSKSLLLGLQQRSHGTGILSMYGRHIAEIGLQCRRCHAPRALLHATALSLIAWAAEAWAFHLILKWMGLPISLTFAMFVYALAMLAGHLSLVPGGLGSAEAVMMGMLIWAGTAKPEAVAATLLCRLVTLWFAVIIGVLSLSVHKHGQHHTYDKRESKQASA